MNKKLIDTILKALRTAPDSQLDEYWKQRCIDFEGSDEKLLGLFEELYNTNNFESSKFIRTMVDPQYTKEYFK